MIANPHPGQLVQLWYNARAARYRALHGMVGRVVVVSRGKPRNHGILTDDRRFVVVPCGNLRKVVAQ